MEKITIFTPTYNRAYVLERVYNSLLNQTNKNFEWLIVDDGSTDNTNEIVQRWIDERKIDIRYIYQENQGKMIAHNVGVLNSKYNLFFCLDSDDYITLNCVEELVNEYNKIKANDNITGIIAKKGFLNKVVKKDFPNVEYTTLMELNYKYNYRYDLLLAYKTKYLKKFLFPKIEGEKFIPEPYVYDQIDQLGKMVLVNKCLYICEYLEDGYTKNVKNNIIKNCKGYTLYAKQAMLFSKSFKVKGINAIRYTMGSWLSKDKNYLCNIKGIFNRIMIIILLPISHIIYIKKYKM